MLTKALFSKIIETFGVERLSKSPKLFKNYQNDTTIAPNGGKTSNK